jgi:hypothetical protein
VAVASFFLAGTARAGYAQLAQSRSLNTSASATAAAAAPSNDFDTEASGELGSFDRSIESGASASGQIPNPPFFASAFGYGIARQSVQLAPTSISAEFVEDAGTQGRVASSRGAAASAWSTNFRVDQPTPFDLGGSLGVRDNSRSTGFTSLSFTASLSLTRRADGGGPEDVLSNVSIDFPPFFGGTTSKPVHLAGVLAPGYVYTLSSDAAAGSLNNAGAISAQIGAQTLTDVRFTLTMVPEPAAASVLALAGGLLLRRRDSSSASD